MLYNFATASASKDVLMQRLADVQTDVMGFLQNGGVSRVEMESEWRFEAAAIVRETVIDLFKMTDPTPIFTERRSGNLGDTYEFQKFINTLRVVEYSPNSDPGVFTPRKAKWTISTNSFEHAWGIDLIKVMTGQHTIGEYGQMAGEALTRHYVDLTLTAINVACATGVNDLKGRPVRTAAAGADVQKTEIDAALRRMVAFNSGVTIFGTRYALDPIYSFIGALSINLADELNARGVINSYRGANIVELVDDLNIFYHSFTTVSGVDLDKLIFIASAIPGAILMERDLSALNWQTIDVQKGTWATGVRFDHGILVHTPWRYHVIQLV